MLALALVALGGCAATQPTGFDSQASYNRTFEAATGAMADQRMIFGVIDRRQGQAVATLNGDTISATLQDQLDGTVRVTFNAQGPAHADPELLKRVIASYNARMQKIGLLGGFKSRPVPSTRARFPARAARPSAPEATMKLVTIGLLILLALVQAELWAGKGGRSHVVQLQSQLLAQQQANDAARLRNQRRPPRSAT